MFPLIFSAMTTPYHEDKKSGIIRKEPSSDREPDCVVLGDARDELNYRNLNQAFRIAKAHKRLIAIGENK